MVKRWLLDTSAWIQYLRDPASLIRLRFAQRARDEIVTCSIVRAELLHGARKYGNVARPEAIVTRALASLISHPFDDLTAERYALVRHGLELAGQVIGPPDLMIAAICLVHGCTLVNANLNEFRRVPGLDVEDWSQA